MERSVGTSQSDEAWGAPPRNFVKCNIRVAWSKMKKIDRASWVLRDQSGVVLLHSGRSIGSVGSKDEAYFLSVVWSMERMVKHRCLRVHFFFEGRVSVNAFNRPKALSSVKFKVKEIRSIFSNIFWN